MERRSLFERISVQNRNGSRRHRILLRQRFRFGRYGEPKPERMKQRFLHTIDRNDLKPVQPREYFLPIFFRNDHFRSPRLKSSLHFSDDAAHRLHFTVDAHFACHGNMVIHRNLLNRGSMATAIEIPADGPSIGTPPGKLMCKS